MEKVEIIYAEYVRLIERHDKILDSSFNDIKLYGIIGSAISLIGTLKEIGFVGTLKEIGDKKEITINEPAYFIAILTLFFVIAIIAFRDLLKQVYITHLTYNIKTAEDYIKANYFEGNELFNLRKTWQEKYFGLMQKAYFYFVLVFFIPLIAFPIYLFNDRTYGIIISLIMIITLITYSVLISRIYGNAKNNEA